MPGGKIRVALVRGGKTPEREVSLQSGAEVLANLDPGRFVVTEYDPATEVSRLAADIEAGRLEVAFLALHGSPGEDGAIQGFLELLGLPYTGSGILASALAMDKEAAKKAYREAGLPVAPDMTVFRDSVTDWSDLARMAFHTFGSPLVVKPASLGSSVAVAIVRDEEGLVASLKLAFGMDGRALLEKYLPGREFTCVVAGTGPTLTPLPPIEIIPGPGRLFFDYAAKYEAGQSQEICPARISPEITSEIQRLAANAHRALGCRALSRSDFIFSEGRALILETNTLPGLTSLSLVPKAARAYGLTYTAFLSYLLDEALNKGGVHIKDYR